MFKKKKNMRDSFYIEVLKVFQSRALYKRVADFFILMLICIATLIRKAGVAILQI